MKIAITLIYLNWSFILTDFNLVHLKLDQSGQLVLITLAATLPANFLIEGHSQRAPQTGAADRLLPRLPQTDCAVGDKRILSQIYH